MMSRVIYIVGPTASGKTGLAISIARQFNGEIICADSRTIYKGLDIGTAKPSEEEKQGIKHYGLDLVNPDETYSVADFANSARGWIKEIQDKNKLPIVVGGTGLYIDALYFNFTLTEKADPELRKDLEQKSLEELHEIIKLKGFKMPENYMNKRYVIRAIERGGVEGQKHQPSKEDLIIGINPGKEILNMRISDRSMAMDAGGVINEAEKLFTRYGYSAPGASGNIYRALSPYFKGESSMKECFIEFQKLDKQLAKRQLTWFKRNKNIKWFGGAQEAEAYLSSIL